MNKKLFFLGCFILALGVDAQLFKVSNQGNILSSKAAQFSCILDNKSKLVWEVKHKTKGLQGAHNTYTWFNGKTGLKNGQYSHHCDWGKHCNTQAFIKALNKNGLCRINAWRLPTETELKTLIRYGDNHLLIDTQYFPNTKPVSYWTSTELDANIAIDVPFFYGGSKSSDKSFDAYIRAVSDAN